MKKFLDQNFPLFARKLRFALEGWRFVTRFSEPSIQTSRGYHFSGNSGNLAMASGHYEPKETALIEKVLPHIEVFINAGANVGYYVCIALSKGKKVVAFEPTDQNLQFLLKNIKENGWQEKAEVYPFAVTSSPGIIEIYGGPMGASAVENFASISKNTSRLVPAFTIDSVISERFVQDRTLLWIDVDGFEEQVIMGAGSLLQRAIKPIVGMEITTEFSPDPSGAEKSRDRIFNYLWNLGYESWVIDTQMNQVRSLSDLEDPKICTNINFLFIDPMTRKSIFPEY
jgi:FkbM family methyltransferase